MTMRTIAVLLVPALAAALTLGPASARDREPPRPELRSLDTNHDGKVTVREFDAAMARARRDPPPQDRREPPRDSPRKEPPRDAPPRGADLDRNHDGVISPAEFQRRQPPPPPNRR